MDKVIVENGGIDLMLVGVGMNGHIGFNEPGVSFDLYAHVAKLDETTTSVGQKYFREATELRQGITLGLKHLLESKKVLMLANGNKKAAIIQRAIEGEITNQLPASIIRRHPNSRVMIDEDVAAMLGR
jgi:6-phosphogluconolactonase/glucosamine-6-phosphate isomerase/deaminase